MINSVHRKKFSGKVVEPQDAKTLLLATIQSGDRVVIEGNNQKQAVFLSKCLADLPPSNINNLHGSEPGMEDYIAARKNIFFTSPDAVL